MRDDFTEILFDEKNKEYGAYRLRRMYDHHLFTGLIVSSVLLVAGLASPVIMHNLFPDQKPNTKEIVVNVENMPLPPGVMLAEYQQPAPPPPPDEDMAPQVVKEEPEPPKEPVEKKPKKDPAPIAPDTRDLDTSSAATQAGSGSADGDPNALYIDVDMKPQFPGGDRAYMQYLNDHVIFPKEEKIRQKTGIVNLTMIIEKDGRLTDITVKYAPTDNFAKEALRVYQNMPRWEPAIRNGRPVRTVVKASVKFY